MGTEHNFFFYQSMGLRPQDYQDYPQDYPSRTLKRLRKSCIRITSLLIE